MSNIIKYNNLLAFHPGSYVEDVMKDLNITQKEFAERLGIHSKVLCELINGEANLSPEVALKLEKLTGVDYQSWMNLQNAYDRKRLEIDKKMEEDEKQIATLIDLTYFKDLGIAENKRHTMVEKITVLRNCLNVSNLCYLSNFNPAVSYRNVSGFEEKNVVNSNVMLEIASNVARNKSENKLNRKKLEDSLPLIKEMLNESEKTFYPKLKETLLSCGVILVGLPNLKNSNLQGATKKFKDGSVLLLITDRNKSADIFWFSLMHEIAHILFSDFYTDKEDKEAYDAKELRADKWAAEFFIPENNYTGFININDFSEQSIVSFAKENNIPVWILIGRLKKDGYLKYNEFKKYNLKYKIIAA